MNCLTCKGACCESFSVELPKLIFGEARTWVEHHATKIEEGENTSVLSLECRCTKLTKDGLCSIYDDRPLICEFFIAGSKDCLDTVKARRTKEEFLAIREEGDPDYESI